MSAPTRMSKANLFKSLMEYGCQMKDIEKLKRPQLIELLNEKKGEEEVGEKAIELLDNMIENEEQETRKSNEVSNSSNNEEMTPEHQDWTQYVLGQFRDDELDGKNPRVEGLRRVAEELIGDIAEEGCDLVSCPKQDNEMRACVKAWVIFNCGSEQRRYEALADAYPGNCSVDYGIYLTAMADTRAKGRCFRNALKLKRVVAAEEVDPMTLPVDKEDYTNPIDVSQLTAIKVVSERINVSISKLLLYMNLEEDPSKIKKGEAKKVLQKLNEMNLTKDIPENLLNKKEKDNA